MKFQVGDEVVVISECVIGHVIEVDVNDSVLPYRVVFRNDGNLWCFADDLELTQAYKNEQKLKKVLGLE